MNRSVLAVVVPLAVGHCSAAAEGRADDVAGPERQPLFVSGQEGYPRVRIPVIVATTRGTLLAFCGGWKGHVDDRSQLSSLGEVDLLLRRSLDNGGTWEPMRVLMGRDDTESWCNYSAVVDRTTRIVWLLVNKSNRQTFATHSKDDGVTWSTPVEISASVSEPSWPRLGMGPVNGIQLASGRLVVPCWMVYKEWSPADSFVVYSDDHGATWKRGELMFKGDGDECTVVETADGKLYMSMRSTGGTNQRGYARSTDGGLTWSPFARDPSLAGRSTQGSVIRFTAAGKHDRNRVLLSMPAGMHERSDLTVRVSYDECKTWPVAKLLHKGPSAYSNLVILPDMTIGCLYEGGEQFKYESVIFARFSRDWLTAGSLQEAGTDHGGAKAFMEEQQR